MGQRQTKLKHETLAELARKTNFTELEVEQWYNGFVKDCPDGYLTMDEFGRIYSDSFPQGRTSRFAEYICRMFDLNQDGLVDFSDFLHVLSVLHRGDLDDKLRLAFSVYDLDRDGFISRSDLVNIVGAIYDMLGAHSTSISLDNNCSEPSMLSVEDRVDQFFRLFEADRLTLDEFASGVKSNPQLSALLLQPLTGGNHQQAFYKTSTNRSQSPGASSWQSSSSSASLVGAPPPAPRSSSWRNQHAVTRPSLSTNGAMATNSSSSSSISSGGKPTMLF